MKFLEALPDLAIYEKATFETEEEEIKTIQIPLAVVEILSPTQNINELVEKSKVYFENGVQSYWLVVPVLKSVFIYHEYGNFIDFQHQEILKDEILGIELDLKLIF